MVFVPCIRRSNGRWDRLNEEGFEMDGGINAGDRPVVSVVIPCLNEAETLAGCIDAARDGIRAAD
jgi:cellulose synthase/poly-beta-1,6-N-acetylglucosamine synthase-like glycosyltransferase